MMKFKGVIPALVSPLCDDETINIPVLHSLVDFLLGKGADGFYVGGETGEGIALSFEERQILAEEAVKKTDGKVPCIIQVASMDFKNAISLAKHAEKIGASAISATVPLFFQYDENDIYNYYKALANAVNIPLMAYYSPAAAFNFNAKFAARLFEIDNLTSIKWTSSNYYEMMKLKDYTHGEMNILNGPDEMLLMGLSAGADGGIGSTYNFMFDTIKEIYDNFILGNMEEAQKAQSKADRIIGVLHQYANIPTTKLLLEAMGFAVGNPTFPMKRYTKEEKETIIKNMKEAGLQI